MEDFIYGRNPVIEYLRAERPINKIVMINNFKKQGDLEEIISLCRTKGIPVQTATRDMMDNMARSSKHQGVIAYIAPREYVGLEDLLDVAKKNNEIPFIVVLDGIEDPHNLGAIIRTAEGAGAQGVVIPKRRASPITSTVVKASSGAVSYLPVAREANINNVIERLKKANIWVVGLDEKGDKVYTQADFTLPTALVIGSEGSGLAQAVKRNCDFLISIPMHGRVASLNASVSAGIVMYEVVRQRGK